MEGAVFLDEIILALDLAHALDRLFEFDEFLVGAVGGGFGGQRGFDDLAGLQHGAERHGLEVEKDGQRMGQGFNRRLADGHAAARTGSETDDALRLQHAQAFTQGRAADFMFGDEFRLGAQQVSGLEPRVDDPAHQRIGDLGGFVAIGRRRTLFHTRIGPCES